MANPFDKFDDSAAAKNPFDRFDAPTDTPDKFKLGARAYKPANMAAVIEDSAGAGLIETALSLGTGIAGQVAGGYAGIGQGLKNLSSQGMPAGERAAQVQEAMTYQPRTSAGKNAAQFLDEALGWIPRGADAIGESAAAASGSPAVGAAINTGIQAIPNLLPLAKPALSGVLAKQTAEAAKKTALAEPKNAAIRNAKEMGLVIPPAEGNPTLVNRIIEGFSGQPKLQQLASSKNVEKLDAVVRDTLGIGSDVPLSIDAFESVRKQAGRAYDVARNAGMVAADADYTKALDAVAAKYTSASQSFPKMAKNEIKDAVDSARVQNFDASAGVDAIKVQREMADKAFRTGDTALGKVHKAVADAIEAQIDRHLQANGGSLDAFRAARQRIAQTYDAQAALKENHIDARVLAKQFEKGRLTGGLAKVGQFGSKFKGAAQVGGKNAYVPSLWETIGMGGVGTLGGLALGSGASLPIMGAIAAGSARPLSRSAMLSRPGQAMLVGEKTYSPSKSVKALNALAAQPEIMNMLGLMASQQDGN